jgi:hypothetical protein
MIRCSEKNQVPTRQLKTEKYDSVQNVRIGSTFQAAGPKLDKPCSLNFERGPIISRITAIASG